MRSAARCVPPSFAISAWRSVSRRPPPVVDERKGRLAQGFRGGLLRRDVAGDTERLQHVRVAELVDGLRYGDHRSGRGHALLAARPHRRA
nr:hypothetical protein [Streptomyces sp. F001]